MQLMLELKNSNNLPHKKGEGSVSGALGTSLMLAVSAGGIVVKEIIRRDRAISGRGKAIQRFLARGTLSSKIFVNSHSG